MPEMDFKVLQNVVTLEQLCEELAKLQKQIRYIINGQIDFENVRARSIKAGNIETETLTASEIAANAITTAKIDAGAITTAKIAAGAVTADKITVTELSAITANMGTLTAGSITTNAEINVGTDATVGNNLTVGFGSNDRAIGLGGAVLKYTTFLDLFSPSEAQLRSAVSDVVLDGQLGSIIAKSSSGTIADVPTAINAAQSTANSALSGLSGKQNSFTGFTGSRTVITSVNFGTSTTTSKTLNFTNGVLTNIT